LISVIVIFGLINSLNAAAADPVACATATAPIQKCASDGTAATTGAANCNAGYYFTFVATATSTCTACALGTYVAAQTATLTAVVGTNNACTACITG